MVLSGIRPWLKAIFYAIPKGSALFDVEIIRKRCDEGIKFPDNKLLNIIITKTDCKGYQQDQAINVK